MAGGRYSWFPGHMAKALKQMEERLKFIDILVEVRDARLPFSSANPVLNRLVACKRRLVVLNKVDLADPAATKTASSLLQAQGHRVVPCVAVRDGSAGRVLDAALSWLQSAPGQRRPDLSLLMVAGAPNTGKSSLINALKRASQREGLLEGEQAYQRTAVAGPLPGVTRQLGGFKVCRSPLLYVLDTPGLLPTALPDEGVAVRLALAGLMPADAAGLDDVVLVRHLVQLLVSEPRHQRQLWMAADGQVAAALARQRAAARGAGADGRRGGGPGPDGGGWRLRESGSVVLARALHDVVTMPLPPGSAWHPGMDDGDPQDEDDEDSVAEEPYPLYDEEADGGDRRQRGAGYGRGGIARSGGGGGERSRGSGSGARLDAERRVAAFLRQVTRGSVVNVGRRNALLRSVLQCFREGALGRYTLDQVGQPEGDSPPSRGQGQARRTGTGTGTGMWVQERGE